MSNNSPDYSLTITHDLTLEWDPTSIPARGSGGARSLATIDALMQLMPEQYQKRWCGGERGACFCMGCVQILNRKIMWEAMMGRRFLGDPEGIVESRIPSEIQDRYKVTRDDWERWSKEQP